MQRQTPAPSLPGRIRRRSARAWPVPWLLVAACAPSTASPPNVVVIVMDTVRPDLLSVYGHERPTTPFLERFAAEGTRYDRVYAPSNWTLASHASLFTGVLPRVHRADQLERHVADSLPLLAERLAEAGYQTVGLSNNAWVSERTGLARGFETFRELSLGDPGAGKEGPGARDPRGHRTVRSLWAWFQRRRDPERPFFCFVNVVEPHLPYLPPWAAVEGRLASQAELAAAVAHLYPDGVGMELVRRHYLERPALTEREWELLRVLYEGELRVVDSVVERLVGVVDEAADPRETVVFVLSDHGENLGEHGHFTHFFNVYDTNLRVPLLVRGPGFAAGAVDDRPAQVQDLYPTILSLAGLAVEEHVTGVDLRGPADPGRLLLASVEYPEVTLGIFAPVLAGHEGEPPPPLLAHYLVDLSAAVGPRFKLLRRGDGREELYDLRADPGEERPLAPEDVPPDALARLRDALATRLGEPAPSGAHEDPLADPETRAEIRALGYADESE